MDITTSFLCQVIKLMMWIYKEVLVSLLTFMLRYLSLINQSLLHKFCKTLIIFLDVIICFTLKTYFEFFFYQESILVIFINVGN